MVLYPLIVGFFIVALLYSSVGHGGASGYLAWMTLLSFAPESMRTTALCLNIIASAMAAVRFYRSGYFRKELLWPFAITSIPMAFVGGSIPVSSFESQFKWILAACLVIAVIRLLIEKAEDEKTSLSSPPLPLALMIGAVIGLVSGMIGIGGGVLLSPVLLLARWSTLKQASAVSAPFIFLNSVAALLGNHDHLFSLHPMFPLIMASVVAGAYLGSDLGSRVFNTKVLRILLSCVLTLAVIKLFI
ncbi:MAG: sulfite exporter TauE/SafE family protein [Bacteroidota bacterium]